MTKSKLPIIPTVQKMKESSGFSTSQDETSSSETSQARVLAPLVINKLLASRSLVLASPSPSTTLVLMSSPRCLLEGRRRASPDLYIYTAPD
jgi:hypothetical protein